MTPSRILFFLKHHASPDHSKSGIAPRVSAIPTCWPHDLGDDLNLSGVDSGLGMKAKRLHKVARCSGRSVEEIGDGSSSRFSSYLTGFFNQTLHFDRLTYCNMPDRGGCH